MNVVDSSAWLEYFAGGPNADYFAGAIENPAELLVPTICLYEVFRHFIRFRSEQEGLQAVAVMQQGRCIELSAELSLTAARRGLLHKLPLADSIIWTTAVTHGATLWTQDSHFQAIPGVKFKAKVPAATAPPAG